MKHLYYILFSLKIKTETKYFSFLPQNYANIYTKICCNSCWIDDDGLSTTRCYSQKHLQTMTRSIHARMIYASRGRNRSTSSYDNWYRRFCMTKSSKWHMVCSILTRGIVLMNTIRCIQWNQLRIFPSTTTPYCYYRYTARYICLWMCKSYMVCIGENLISIRPIFFAKANCPIRPTMPS